MREDTGESCVFPYIPESEGIFCDEPSHLNPNSIAHGSLWKILVYERVLYVISILILHVFIMISSLLFFYVFFEIFFKKSYAFL